MLNRNRINDVVSKAVDSYQFDKISDLSKDEFSELLSAAMIKVLESPEFVEHVDSELGKKSRRIR